MPTIFLLLASVLALVILCLHSGYLEAYTVCWINQQLYMNYQDIVTYFPLNLASSMGVHSGNCSVQAFSRAILTSTATSVGTGGNRTGAQQTA